LGTVDFVAAELLGEDKGDDEMRAGMANLTV
jgi:hypothetical protein